MRINYAKGLATLFVVVLMLGLCLSSVSLVQAEGGSPGSTPPPTQQPPPGPPPPPPVIVGKVAHWGNTQNIGPLAGHLPILRPEFSNAKQVAATTSSYVLKADGTVWFWPRSNFDPCTEIYLSQGQVYQLTTLSNIQEIATGDCHILARKSDGTVWAWGKNDFGQLGNGTTQSEAFPIQLPRFNNVKAIFAGGRSSFAIKQDGTVWGWGKNDFGQLGQSQFNPIVTTPTLATSLTGIKAIATGDHTLLLFNNGVVAGMGQNNYGQLGNGTTTPTATPTQINNLSDVKAVETGYKHSLALKNDGTVWAWGWNDDAQLGDGTTTAWAIPVSVTTLGNNVKAIAAGYRHSLALKNDGTVWGWGNNCGLELGFNPPSPPVQGCSALPVIQPKQATLRYQAISIFAGEGYSMAIVKP